VDQALQELTIAEPVLFLIDDLQWTDAASLDLLRSLIRRGHRGGRAFLATLRPHECPASSPVGLFLADMIREQCLFEVPLSPLTQAESKHFLSALLEHVDPEVVRILYAQTGGFPFFLQEQVRLLVSERSLQREQGVWRFSEATTRSDLPLSRSITATILRRLRHFPMEVQKLLQAAAVLGTRFALALALAGLGQYEAALSQLQTLQDLAAVIGEPYFAVRVPNTIGWIYRELLLVERALEWDRRSVEQTEQENWPGLFEARANGLLNLVMDLVLLGRLDEADETLQRAMEATERDEFMRWRNRNRLALTTGELLLARGNAQGALLAAEDALAQAQSTRSGKYRALAHDLAGRALVILQREEKALNRFELAAAEADTLGYSAGHWRTLVHLAHLLKQLGQTEKAAISLSQAKTCVETIAVGLHTAELRTAFLATAPVAALLAPHTQRSSESGSEAQKRRIRLASLSPRETEVFLLLADGLTNQAMARRLSISERTVNSHLVHIFNKLGVNNRVAAAAFALRQGLAE
jgi:DNA-binding CsgD family transcriptional regulator